MRKRFYIIIWIAAWIGTWSTAIAQPMRIQDNIALDNVSLTRVNDEMVLALDLVLNDLELRSSQSLVFVPYINAYEGMETAWFQPIIINGRKQHILYQRGRYNRNYPDAAEFRRLNGEPQTVRYISAIPYDTWMEAYKVGLLEDVCGCGELLAQNNVQVAQYLPLPTTAFFVFIEPEVVYSKSGSVEGKAYLDFPVNQSTIDPGYRRNPEELAVILETINVMENDPNITITGIDIHGYASPEGSYSNNARLAASRAEALKEYVRHLYKFDEGLFTVTSTPEDWEGLIEWLTNSDLPQKEALLAIATSDLSPDAKDRKIRDNYGSVYRDVLLIDCYPSLRHSDYVVHYVIRPFTAEEALALLKKNPAQLSLHEIYMAASLFESQSPEFAEILYVAATLFPESETANVNAANAALAAGDTAAAQRFLAKAGDSGEAQLTRGILQMWQGHIDQARLLFQEAAAKGVAAASQNLKLIENY